MAGLTSARIEEHFGSLTDPRRRDGIYPLLSIVTIAPCAVISGADAATRTVDEKRFDLASPSSTAGRHNARSVSYGLCLSADG